MKAISRRCNCSHTNNHTDECWLHLAAAVWCHHHEYHESFRAEIPECILLSGNNQWSEGIRFREGIQTGFAVFRGEDENLLHYFVSSRGLVMHEPASGELKSKNFGVQPLLFFVGFNRCEDGLQFTINRRIFIPWGPMFRLSLCPFTYLCTTTISERCTRNVAYSIKGGEGC